MVLRVVLRHYENRKRNLFRFPFAPRVSYSVLRQCVLPALRGYLTGSIIFVCFFGLEQGDRPKLVGSAWSIETGGDQWDAGIVDLLDEEFQKANGGLSLKGDAMALTR